MTIWDADVVIKVVFAALSAGVVYVGSRRPNLAGVLSAAVLIKGLCMTRALRCPSCGMSA